MAERWQQWMPHDIDSWQGSANIQALSDIAYRAVHNLLMDMWKQVDCALPIEDRELAKRSRIAHRWVECRDEVMEYFCDRTEDGRITHRVLFEKWNKARTVFEKKYGSPKSPDELYEVKSKAGKIGAQVRWHKDGKQIAGAINSDGRGIANDGLQEHIQEHIQVQSTNTLASTAIAVPAARGKLLGTLPLTGGRTYEVREDDLARDGPLYPGVDLQQEYRKMKGWLLADPKRQKTPQGIHRFMNNWLSSAQDKAKPGAGNGNYKGKTEHSLDAANEAIAIIRAADEQERANRRFTEAIRCEAAGEIGYTGLLGLCGGSGDIPSQ